MKQAQRVQTISVCLLAAVLTLASNATFAKERDRDERRGNRSADHGEVQRNRTKQASDHKHRTQKIGKRKHCFECRIDNRQARQQARIRGGWVNGDLTRKEHKQLKKKQRRIERMERRFGADGKFTRAERKRLVRALDRSSNKVYRLKHNDRYQRSQRFAHDYRPDHHWRSW